MIELGYDVKKAVMEKHHDQLTKLARTSKFTRDFSNHIFSGEAAYAKGWIRKIEVEGLIIGFTCVRHLVRHPHTKLYFVTVDPEWRGKQVGEALLKDLENETPHKRIELDVNHQNPDARRFYERLGYQVIDNKVIGKDQAWLMRKDL